MKKVLLFLLTFLYVSKVVLAEEIEKTKFVNPVFNQPLEPMSMRSGYEYLTPTSVDFRTPLDKNIKNAEGECVLLENTEDHIKMFCKMTWYDYDSFYKSYNLMFKNEKYYLYKVIGLFFEGCLDIEEISYKEGQQEYASELHYCVTPSKDMTTTD